LIFVGGDFTTVNGNIRNGIVRLNGGGNVNQSFNPGAGVNPGESVYAMESQGLDKLLIGGRFTAYNGQPRKNLSRLFLNGQNDANFSSVGPDNVVHGILYQPQIDRLVVVGNFKKVGLEPRKCVVRLKSDGKIDTVFNPGRGADGPIYVVRTDNANRLLVGGDFISLDSVGRNRLARIGEIDTIIIGVYETKITFQKTISVYPNPTQKTNFRLKGQLEGAGQNVTIRVMNSLGQQVLEENLPATKLEQHVFSFDSASDGLHTLQIQSGKSMKVISLLLVR
jgi:hypothetical protein